MSKIDKYIEGLLMEQFQHIPQISVYNSNYYVGIDNDLIYAESDDDNLTEYWVVEYQEFKYIGYSFESENNRLHATKERIL